MQWYKAKTILIIFFIIIDSALLLYLAADKVSNAHANDAVIKNTIALLDENNISVDYDTVKNISVPDSIKNVYAENAIGDYGEFAKKVLGGEPVFKDKNYLDGKSGNAVIRADEFEVKAKRGVFLYENDVSSEDLEYLVLRYLKTIGFDTGNGALIDVDKRSEYNYAVTVKKTVNSREVFDVNLKLEIIPHSGVKSVCGSWFNERKTNTSTAKLKGISSVLAECIKEVKDHSERMYIESITLGYYKGDNDVYHESVLLTPVWKIIFSNGETVFIDARENQR